MYNELINRLHTPLFLMDMMGQPTLKGRLLDLTELPESYVKSCFETSGDKPQKLIWAWDLWRAIGISAGAFSCGFITEEEAWENIYRASDLSHYLFDDLEDFYNNVRLGHAYWCDDEKLVYKRKSQIDAFLHPEKGTERRVHKVSWPKIDNIALPENMRDDFAAYLAKLAKLESDAMPDEMPNEDEIEKPTLH